MYKYLVKIFPLGFFTGAVNLDALDQIFAENAKAGYKFCRRLFSFEITKVLLILPRLSWRLVFEKDESNEAKKYNYQIRIYQTRFFSKTVNVEKLLSVLNEGDGSWELSFATKWTTRTLLIFPRETWFMIFRQSEGTKQQKRSYSLQQTPCGFFTRALNPEKYAKDIATLSDTGERAITALSDEKRILGLFKRRTIYTICEKIS